MSLDLSALDIVVFLIFVIAVIAVGLIKSRGEAETSEDYFLAGRGLTWPLIGFSLIAANISAEQMVGMAGQSANREIGLAIASYEWMAAITLVGVAFFFLPKFLKSGIYTIPQFLEHRFTPLARTVMSLLVVVVLVAVNIGTVTYLGAKFLDPYFGTNSNDVILIGWGIGIAAAIYVAVGGLKACAWADLIQGAALVIGGAVITILAMQALSDPDPVKYQDMNSAAQIATSLGVSDTAGLSEKLGALKSDRMHMFLPISNSIIPWTALVIGLWIPNFYYWGLNQYIMQRTLGSKSLGEGQKGIIFAAGMKLIIPFVVCLPGIIAFVLYSDYMAANAAKDNQKVVEQFQAEQGPGNTLYDFNDDFAGLNPELAQAMLAHNASFASADPAALVAKFEGTKDPADGDVRTQGEVLAAANEEAMNAANKGREKNAQIAKSSTLTGYDYDEAFPVLVSKLAPSGLKGFVVAAVMGAVISSLASMLNAASTVFTMDVYRNFFDKNATQSRLVWVGRICVPIAAVIGCLVAPVIDNPAFKGAFTFIQEFQGFISPGILTIFLFGLFVPKAPRMCGLIGLVLSPIIYGALFFAAKYPFAEGSLGAYVIVPFLNRMAITVIAIALVLAILTIVKPAPEPIKLPEQQNIELTSSKTAKILGIAVIALTLVLYVVFA